MQKDNTKIIRYRITAMLAKREHCKKEILQKLSSKHFDESEILQVLKQFEESNIQSDERYVEVLVRSAYSKGKGPKFVRQTLRNCNINESLAEPYINLAQYDWFELARETYGKKFGEDSKALDYKEISKRKRFLLYRGFEEQHIRYIFS